MESAELNDDTGFYGWSIGNNDLEYSGTLITHIVQELIIQIMYK